MSNTPRILDIDIELPLASNSQMVDEKIAEHNSDAEAHPYILGVLDEKANSADLADVATSGNYDDLENKPDIPSLTGYATETYVGNAVSTHNGSNVAHTDIRNEISSIQELIPSQAASDNKLADKNFVNSSIATETATFRGTYNEVTDLSLTTAATHSDIATAIANVISTADSNDYSFVQIPTADATPTEIARIERYKFVTGTGWQFEYTLNNSGFTAAQWAAINSGITSGLVTQIGTNMSDILTIQGAISSLTTGLSGKVSKTGDTMTGWLKIDGDVQRNLGIMVKRPAGSSLEKCGFGFANYDSSITFGPVSGDETRLTGAWLKIYSSYVRTQAAPFYQGAISDDNKLLKRSDADARWLQIAPPISTTATLVSGSFNELGTIDYSTIALPSSPGTAEYNGTFTSSNAGDIRNNTGLSGVTKWQGDVTIEANATYSFCFQNGFGIIVKML